MESARGVSGTSRSAETGQAPSTHLLLDDASRRALWTALVDFVERYLETVPQKPVAPTLDRSALRAFLEPFTFEDPIAPGTVLQKVARALEEHQVHTPHPCYFGLFNPAPSAMGIAAETLAAVLNPQLAAWSHSPLAVEIERHVVSALGTTFGYERSAVDGAFTTGGAEANATALLCALTSRWPDAAHTGVRGLPADPVVYLSAEGHHSFLKAARAAGLGERSVRRVPVDPSLAMDVPRLREMISADRRQGHAPFMLAGTAGSTGTAAIDPLPALADIAREEGLWFHVDAAWAGAVRLVPARRHLLDGIEQADSITFDPHKWLSVPMGAGLFLTKRPDALTRAFALDTGYMPRDGREHAAVDPYAHSMQWSRRFSGLKVFLTLAVAGWDGYAAVIEHQIAMGGLLRERLTQVGWRMLNRPDLPLVCFTRGGAAWDLDAHQAVADRVIRSGRAWISTVVTARGDAALRACVTNYRTSPQDVETLIETLEAAVRDERSGGRVSE